MAALLLLFVLFVGSTVNANPFCPRLSKYHGFEQRPDNTEDIDFYVAERSPSYCDRVVLGWSHMKPDPSLTVHQYNAITDEYLDESDHDLVYGYFTFQNINILSVSFNLGDFVKADIKKQIAWDTIICSIKSALQTNKKPGQPGWEHIDIFFFGFQEADFPFKYNKLSGALKHYIVNSDATHKWKTVFKSLGPRRLAYRNTAAYILYNARTVFHDEESDKTKQVDEYPRVDGRISEINFKQDRPGKELMHTKTGEIIGKFRKIETGPCIKKRKFSFRCKKEVSYRSKQFVAFANVHLPIVTSQDDYGVEYRNEGMMLLENTFKHVFNERACDQCQANNNLLVLLGDLNYRIVDGVEQLKAYLDAQRDVFWYELERKQFKPTCKRVAGSWNVWKGLKGKQILDKKKGGKKVSVKKVIGRKVKNFGTLLSESGL